jgi:hypothetical protein
MRRYLYLTAVALTLGFSVSAFAQGGGGFGGMSTGGGGSSSGGGGLSGGGSSFSGGGLSGGGSSLSGGSSLLGGGSSFSGGSTFSGSGAFSGSGGGSSFGGGGTGYGGGRGTAGGSGGFQISPTNQFAGTYVNPLYVGRPGSSNLSMGVAGQQLKGQGFGQPSFGNVTTTTTTGLTGTGIAGRTGTASINRGLTGGVGGLSSSSTPQVSYAATVGFRPPPIAVPVVRADLQAMVNRSSALRVPGNVKVESVGDVIVLRGKVADDDERRLIEGMVRLEPGVHDVRNELEIGP